MNIVKCFQSKYIQIHKYFVMQHAKIKMWKVKPPTWWTTLSTQTNMVALKIKCSFYNHSKQNALHIYFYTLKFNFFSRWKPTPSCVYRWWKTSFFYSPTRIVSWKNFEWHQWISLDIYQWGKCGYFFLLFHVTLFYFFFYFIFHVTLFYFILFFYVILF